MNPHEKHYKINVNKLFDYISKLESAQEAACTIIQLKKLRTAKKKLDLYNSKTLDTPDMLNALQNCAKYLSKIDKEKTYIHGEEADIQLYDAFRALFKDKNPVKSERIMTIGSLFTNINELETAGYLDTKDKGKYLNFFISYNKFGIIDSFSVSEFIELLFDHEMRTDVKLAVEVLQ